MIIYEEIQMKPHFTKTNYTKVEYINGDLKWFLNSADAKSWNSVLYDFKCLLSFNNMELYRTRTLWIVKVKDVSDVITFSSFYTAIKYFFLKKNNVVEIVKRPNILRKRV